MLCLRVHPATHCIRVQLQKTARLRYMKKAYPLPRNRTPNPLTIKMISMMMSTA